MHTPGSARDLQPLFHLLQTAVTWAGLGEGAERPRQEQGEPGRWEAPILDPMALKGGLEGSGQEGLVFSPVGIFPPPELAHSQNQDSRFPGAPPEPCRSDPASCR